VDKSKKRVSQEPLKIDTEYDDTLQTKVSVPNAMHTYVHLWLGLLEILRMNVKECGITLVRYTIAQMLQSLSGVELVKYEWSS